MYRKCRGGADSGHVEVQIPVPVHIDPGGPIGSVRLGEAGRSGDVFERAVTTVSEQEIGVVEPGGEEVDVAVAIVVTGGCPTGDTVYGARVGRGSGGEVDALARAGGLVMQVVEPDFLGGVFELGRVWFRGPTGSRPATAPTPRSPPIVRCLRTGVGIGGALVCAAGGSGVGFGRGI